MSVYPPQSNRAVERANALIFEAIKKILEDEKKSKWAKIMPRIVWSHNTIVCRETNFTPFQLMYGADAVLPEEVKHRTLWTTIEVPACPSEVEEKDLLVPVRLKVVANLQKYQEERKAWRDPKVKIWELDVGDLVLLRSPRTESTSKLKAKWAGPLLLKKSQGQAQTVYQTLKAKC
jgi:hypothetical protein